MIDKIQPSQPRDLRLDFFRALALLVIFVAHMPDNLLAQYRPGSFGFSDSADIFVFISGYSASLAYIKIFRSRGFWVGTARVAKRCAELYASHLGLFFTVATLMVAGNRFLNTGVDYVNLLNLNYFFVHTEEALVGLFTLTYVPNYFDILPMYLFAMAMLPLVILLARLHRMVAVLLCTCLYIAVPVFKLELPGEIAFYRPWFFNPFGWQFLFYTGLFLGAGWVKAPPLRGWLAALCALYLILCIPLSHYPTYSQVAWLKVMESRLEPWVDKTNLGVLRWLHFLSLAYLVLFLLRGRFGFLKSKIAAPFVKTGQQSLVVFLSGMALAHVAGMTLDVWGRTLLSTCVVNAAGIVILMVIAYVAAWFKSQPWRGGVKKGPEGLPALPGGISF
jgi:hypothetical protein